MAAAVYGSPRHNSRILVGPHLSQGTELAPSTLFIASTAAAGSGHPSIITPASTYCPTSGTPSAISAHHLYFTTSAQQQSPITQKSTALSHASGSHRYYQQQQQQQQHTHRHSHNLHTNSYNLVHHSLQDHHHSMRHYDHAYRHHESHFYHNQRHAKRKSAVELLEESKAYYVKSETVLDRQQQLNVRGNTANYKDDILSPARTMSLQKQQRPTSRRCIISNSDLLQTNLRKLLNEASRGEGGTLPAGGKYDSSSNFSSPKLDQELTIHADPQTDTAAFFPNAFLSPQSLPPHLFSDDDIFSFRIDGIDDTLVLTDDYRAISPPAEYGEVVAAVAARQKDRTNDCRPLNSSNRYQRSFSHSQTASGANADYSPSTYNINSHKSLPDLHSAHISHHSPHSEAVSSSCSRGNRSHKSGSSFNARDSGGSSGNYTHRSEPCFKQQVQAHNLSVTPQVTATLPLPTFFQSHAPSTIAADFRRDSGSSTQHSGNSYYAYGVSAIPATSSFDCLECRATVKDEFDSPTGDCLLFDFPTPEVPEAFQDDYEPKVHYAKPPNELSPPLGTFKRQRCLRFKHRGRYSAPSSTGDEQRPILRSKSDISYRYWNRSTPMLDATGIDNERELPARGRRTHGIAHGSRVGELERFFDRLGLNAEHYAEYIEPTNAYVSSDNDSNQSSIAFLSDISAVDATRLPDNGGETMGTSAAVATADSLEPTSKVPPTSTGTLYRPSEPPSIIERNARIIKWLCNCKKLKLT